jgi:hypothetical protein
MMRVGITGHQRLDESDAWLWVARAIRDELSRVKPPLVAVTSLAVGADQLLARLVVECGGAIYAVLPFADVERSFSPKDRLAYRELVQEATVEVLNTEGTDEDAYLAAGRRVVDLSDIVFAVWNGRPAMSKGGTADVVTYAVACGRRVTHINPILRTVQQLENREWRL